MKVSTLLVALLFAALGACTVAAQAPEVMVYANGVQVAHAETPGQNFGAVEVFGQSAPLTITLENTSANAITFGTINTEFFDAVEFEIDSSTMVNPLPVAQATSFTITYRPTRVESSAGIIVIPFSAAASGSSPFWIHVRGGSYAVGPFLDALVNVWGGGYVAHQQLPAGTVRDFGNHDVVAGPTATIPVVISNEGTGNLVLSAPSISGAGAGEFVVNAAGMLLSLAAGQSTSFTVAFDPNTVGVKDALIQVPHNDGYHPTSFEIPVSGIGAASPMPTMRLRWSDWMPDGGSANFGVLHIGSLVWLTYIIRNTGSVDLNLTGATPVQILNPTWCTAFVSTGVTSTVIAPGDTTTFTVEVHALAPESVSFEISIGNDDPSHQPYDIVMNGEGTGPVAPTELRVISQPANSAAGQVLTNAPVAAITDAAGNVATSDNSTHVQVAITSGTGDPAASLSGTVVVTAVNGIVTFPDLQVSHAGNGYTLTFSDVSGPLGSVVSDPFDVAGSGGGNDDDGEEESCSSGTTRGVAFPAVLLLAGMVLLWRRKRQTSVGAGRG